MIPDWTFDQPLWLLGWILIPLAVIAFAVLKKNRFKPLLAELADAVLYSKTNHSTTGN
jgi:hypothetical protein